VKTMKRTKKLPAGTLFENRRFRVTRADICTPTVYYPVAGTTGRIRRDILFCALCYAAAAGLLLFAYADLWRPEEIAAMGGSILLALIAGGSFSILQIDARGFPSRMFIARRRTIRALFDAISQARALSCGGDAAFGETEDEA